MRHEFIKARRGEIGATCGFRAIDPLNRLSVEWEGFPQQPDDMRVIGLTGGIGTGKTQVSKLLEDLGAEIIDADLLVHEAYRSHSEAWKAVVEAFGEDVLAPSGEVDRKRLGEIVFRDPQALRRLNAITHPRIKRMVEERIGRLREDGRDVVVVEAALLLEANWRPMFSELWVTTASEDQVFRRLHGRNGLDEEAIRARIGSQMPQAERVKQADVVIDTSGSIAELTDRVRQLWEGRVSPHPGEQA